MPDYSTWRRPRFRTLPHGGKFQTGGIPRDLHKLVKLWPLPITTESLCIRLGCSRATLYRHVKMLNLPLRGQGRRVDAGY